ncbi:carbohydrate sulfotransferase 15 [Plakobranchus ocellatus]|uniref:Carbohydrate sulfotransferase 15 n=1 Tax=Plakobranchus ocellatus TaxID=259542 RepID=A0AAV3ZC92_9GAST|nr:carbohydrate sulfotransferase 15 [Plakobranchus ocellatus]
MITFWRSTDMTSLSSMAVLFVLFSRLAVFFLVQSYLEYVTHLFTGIPPPLVGLIENIEDLKGRHSDYIGPPCQNKSSAPQSNLTSKRYDFLGPFPYLQNYKNPCWLPKDSARVKCVPYFYLIGAPKAGSTDVFWRIKGHPHVTSGRAKEVRWFDRLRFIKKGDPYAMPTFEDYLAFFERPTSLMEHSSYKTKNGTVYHHRVLADGSPTYYFSSFNWPLMPGNEGCQEPRVTAMSHIHHLWPKAKLILVLRNPVTRLFSTYMYNTHLPNFTMTAGQFDKWVKQSMGVWYECLGKASFRHCMYDRHVIFEGSAISTFAAGIYSRYILDLLKIFPRKQIYFVHLETYSENIKETLKEIFSFLDLPALSDHAMEAVSEKNGKRRNRGKNYAKVPEMWPSTRKLLDNFYAPYNAELSAILDGDPRWLWS